VEIVVETNTRIMRSKISGNFGPSRCITNENSSLIFSATLFKPGAKQVQWIQLRKTILRLSADLTRHGAASVALAKVFQKVLFQVKTI
jgi:hypothetical protein